MESFSFGDDPRMTDELLNLVIQGRKTATSWAAVHGVLEDERVGGTMIIKDSEGNSRVLIEVTELNKKKFNEIDESFAKDEGEGDLSLEYWRKEHQAYFEREGTFSKDMEVFCQRFKVVKLFALR